MNTFKGLKRVCVVVAMIFCMQQAGWAAESVSTESVEPLLQPQIETEEGLLRQEEVVDENGDIDDKGGCIIVVSIAGDANNDGVVDLQDFAIVKSNFGSKVPAGTGGDLNGDEIVDIQDFGILKANFGNSVYTDAEKMIDGTLRPLRSGIQELNAMLGLYQDTLSELYEEYIKLYHMLPDEIRPKLIGCPVFPAVYIPVREVLAALEEVEIDLQYAIESRHWQSIIIRLADIERGLIPEAQVVQEVLNVRTNVYEDVIQRVRDAIEYMNAWVLIDKANAKIAESEARINEIKEKAAHARDLANKFQTMYAHYESLFAQLSENDIGFKKLTFEFPEPRVSVYEACDILYKVIYGLQAAINEGNYPMIIDILNTDLTKVSIAEKDLNLLLWAYEGNEAGALVVLKQEIDRLQDYLAKRMVE